MEPEIRATGRRRDTRAERVRAKVARLRFAPVVEEGVAICAAAVARDALNRVSGAKKRAAPKKVRAT